MAKAHRRRNGFKMRGALVVAVGLALMALAAGYGGHPWWRVGPGVYDPIGWGYSPVPTMGMSLLPGGRLGANSTEVNVILIVNNTVIIDAAGSQNLDINIVQAPDAGINVGVIQE